MSRRPPCPDCGGQFIMSRGLGTCDGCGGTCYFGNVTYQVGDYEVRVGQPYSLGAPPETTNRSTAGGGRAATGNAATNNNQGIGAAGKWALGITIMVTGLIIAMLNLPSLMTLLGLGG